MPHSPKLILIGASGFGAEVAWILSRMPNAPLLIGFCDDALDKNHGSFCGFPLLGSPESAAPNLDLPILFHCAVGDNAARKTITERAAVLGWTPFSIIDPSAVIAPDACLGRGLFVGAHTVVSCGARIASHVIINHNTVIGHNARLDDFVHICPGANLSGACHIAEGAFLASNTTVIPERRVGAWASIGAATTVLRDIPDHARLLPSPDKILHA